MDLLYCRTQVVAFMKSFIFAFLCCAAFCLSTETSLDYENAWIAHIEQSIECADMGRSKLNDNILNIQGMSSAKGRHFLNNLCSLPGACYLEIGTWRGSTWIAALYGNQTALADAVAIDNWSEFGGPQHEFKRNCALFLGDVKYRFYNQDCFSLDTQLVFPKKVNIYFYDGSHTEQDQELALTYFDNVFDDLFILVVDDWNHIPARIGTMQAIEKLNYDVIYCRDLPSRYNGDTDLYWNGMHVALIRKSLPLPK